MTDAEATPPVLQHPPAAGSPWRIAAVKAVSGLTLGLLTALVLVTLSQTIMPQITEAGVDAGIRLKVGLDRLRYLGEGLPLIERGSQASAEASAGFVFLDLDPENAGPRPSEGAQVPSACKVLADRFQAKYFVADVRDRQLSEQESRGRLALHCEAGRVLNRHVVAQVVAELRKRDAKMIVLDVVLADGDVSDEESRAMNDVLRAPSIIPIVYAAPVQSIWTEEEGNGNPQVSPETSPSVSGPSLNRLPAARQPIAAVAIPEPGQSVRRYAKCVDVFGMDSLPSLPAAAAHIASAPNAAIPCIRTPPPRIVYTVPPLSTHQDDLSGIRQRDAWAFYRQVFNRCLISNFWNPGSLCGADKDKSLFKGKIVVVGTSNPVRRDWHYTPLGNMVGAQVIVNAIRSFVQFPDVHDKSFGEAFASKALIIVVCSCVWFLFHLLRIRTAPSSAKPLGAVARKARAGLVAAGFIATLFAVIALTVWMSFQSAGPAPSLDILLGVLAISLEQFVEVAHLIVHKVETVVQRWFGLSAHSA